MNNNGANCFMPCDEMFFQLYGPLGVGRGCCQFFLYCVAFISNAMTFMSDVYVYDVYIYGCLRIYLYLAYKFIFTFVFTFI